MESSTKPYRGPPPRKDLVVSPRKEKDWIGNDLFNTHNHLEMDCNLEEKQEVIDDKAAGVVTSATDIQHRSQSQRDYGSEYSKLALNGGQKDLLKMDADGAADFTVKQRGENFSEYSKLARHGGHQGLLRMDKSDDGAKDLDGRRQKGCSENISEYSRLARGGGHKDLLVIAENKPSNRVSHKTASGSWFEHNNNTSLPVQKSPPKNSAPNDESARPQACRPKQNSSNDCLPGGEERLPRCGKKRFDNSQPSQAPFATNY